MTNFNWRYKIKVSFKQILTTVLAILMFVNLPTSVLTKNDTSVISEMNSLKTDRDLIKFSKKIKNMSEYELQNVINYAQINSETRQVTNIIQLKAAWLAAAQVAKLAGYSLSAKLIENSVFNKDYFETNGMFSDKIKMTPLYRTMIRERDGQAEFTKPMDKDLYYSLHGFSYTSSQSSSGMRLYITDTYDFELDTGYDSVFTSIVNNWAYLCQTLGFYML